VHATCVDLTDVLGRGSDEHLTPIRTEAGPLLVPIDREVVELVWSDHGYPSGAAYRDTHARTEYEHQAWRNDGAVYDRAAAAEQVRADARDFAERVAARTAGGGLCVCALDTELLGHWWFEGVAWLGAVVEACAERGVELVHLDDAVGDTEPAPARALPITTWGRGRDLRTWSAPRVADLVWQARAAELRAVSRAADLEPAAVRELLALQASDWAFVVSEELAEPYGRERAAAHRAALDAGGGQGPRALAPHANAAPLLAP
jgi:1,4-alpha-glucan branching enzyme